MGLLLISSLLQLSGNEAEELFRYQRTAILEGEYWRLITAHLVHGTWRHWMLNMAGLGLIWAIFPRHFGYASTLPLILGLMLMTSVALLICNPSVGWYVGMSALLHGLFTAWCCIELLRGSRIALVPLLLVGVKLIYEQCIGPLPGSEESTGLPVLVDAHLYAALAGAFLGGVLTVFGWGTADEGAEKRRSL